jgi:flavin reductase (DIM6/NTAB) family NADH-FMN oxidoreductase RutF
MDQVHRFFATTVGLVTSHHDGKSNVMACEWTFCVCWKPLKVMILVHHAQLTNDYIKASGQFGVNLCSNDMAAQSNLSGSVSGREQDKLADSLFSDALYDAVHIDAPMIEGALINIECEVESSFEMGNYTAFIGRALEAEAYEDKVPLLYHQGKYFSMGEQIAKT